VALRKVIKAFRATRLSPEMESSCEVLEDYDTTGDVEFKVGMAPLNDGFHPQEQVVNGKQFAQFTFSSFSYCVERSIYEESTERITPQ